MKRLVYVLLVLFLTACASAPATPSAGLTDREGNPISPPEKADRIVTMGPSNTEIVISLGLGDRLVAVDTFSTAMAPGVPAFDMMRPDAEQLLALRPDLVLVTGMSKANGIDMYKALSDAGVCVAYIPVSADIEGIKEDILFLGELTGTAQAASDIVARFEAELLEFRRIGEDAAEAQSVYFEVEAAPSMYSFGSGVFLDEMITLLGAENIFAGQKEWISVSAEAVIERDPDVIFTNVSYLDDPVGEIMSRDGWGNISAVKNGRVHQISLNPSSLPDQNITVALREMAVALYD